MLKTTRRVLKANQVTFNDPLSLGLDSAPRSGDADPRCTSGGPSVRVAESQPEYAVLEVTCACGKTTYIRCEYATAQPPVRPATAETSNA